MLTRVLLVAALAGLCSCSAAVERPASAHGPSKSSELGVFMKTHVNPPFSKISFLLFHDGDDGIAIGPDVLPASAAELARAADRLSKWPDPPTGSAESTLVFREYAESLKGDALNLSEALRSPQRTGAIKVFESLRKKCDSCHHFFRYDESVNLGKQLKVAESRL